MMFRLTIFSIVAAVRGDDEQASLLQTASRDTAVLMAKRARTIADFERELDGAMTMKGGCSKYMAAELAKANTKHYLEEDAVAKEWKDTFNYKRKVKNDVKAAPYCTALLVASPAKTDADFKDSKCKTAEKAKKQCSKTLKANCNFVRSATRKLFKKALKGSRKVRKEAGFTAIRDPLKTEVNAFSCTPYKKVAPAALKVDQFDAIEAHYTAIYAKIKALKADVDTRVGTKDAKKLAHKAAMKKAADDEDKCEDAAEAKEDADVAAAQTIKDAADVAAETSTTLSEDAKKTAKNSAKEAFNVAKTKADADKKAAEKQCEVDEAAAKKAANDALNA